MNAIEYLEAMESALMTDTVTSAVITGIVSGVCFAIGVWVGKQKRKES